MYYYHGYEVTLFTQARSGKHGGTKTGRGTKCIFSKRHRYAVPDYNKQCPG